MFKKFKDKLAEEVKSSPQRLQQFAQAAQAAVTSASSSVSDITNNDLFSIGDNESSNKTEIPHSNQSSTYLETNFAKPESLQVSSEIYDNQYTDNQRIRRLSNSSFSSDVSFRLPSYESPPMYRLQSDMEVSASEAEEKSSFGGMVNLDRVTKEQLYGAYRRTQDRCSKYKSQYSDLARHYKLLERENAKARNVLVETQDKALRRISELREQCSLEQSAKAHLEQVLRTEIEERDIKIKSLSSNISLHNSNNTDNREETNPDHRNTEGEAQLINFESNKQNDTESITNDATILNKKIEKMELLLNKYKESLKLTKEKNAQYAMEIKIISTELEKKSKENADLNEVTNSLQEAKNKINELTEQIEELQNKNNSLEFIKNKETSILEINLKNDQEKIIDLRSKIDILSKREEEYAISLAENKLSIHKELEGKEAEIRTLKESLTSSQNEVKTLQNMVTECKTDIAKLEKEQSILKNSLSEFDVYKDKLLECQKLNDNLIEKCKSLESLNNKSLEEYKCLQLQLKQESAEKLAMIDRNHYLENRNTLLIDENSKKGNKIKDLEANLHILKLDKEARDDKSAGTVSEEQTKLTEEINIWKSKCNDLENEIQDERVELGNLQAEIEKLLRNHELLQKENKEMNITIEDLKRTNLILQKNITETENIKSNYLKLKVRFIDLKHLIKNTLEDIKLFQLSTVNDFKSFSRQVNNIKQLSLKEHNDIEAAVQNIKLKENELKIQLQNTRDQCSSSLKEINMLKVENENLKTCKQQSDDSHRQEIEKISYHRNHTIGELNKLQEDYKRLQKSIDQDDQEKSTLSGILGDLQNRNNELLKNVEVFENDKNILKAEIESKTALLKNTEERLSEVHKNYTELLEIKKENDEKSINLLHLEKEISKLKEENLLLKNTSEKISENLEELEKEMKDVKESHSNIEREKSHLSSIIEKLERSSNMVENKETQSDTLDDIPYRLQSQIENVNELKEIIVSLQDENKRLSNISISTENSNILYEYENLKVDNKRLQSDIEGLQIYMMKVSKENDELNNKIRELIATSEKTEEKNDMELLKDDSQFKNEQIENLLRENSLLVEENLELKDQIHSQTTNRYDDLLNKSNTKSNDVSYKQLMEDKSVLENRLKDLEDMNFTVNKDMLKMQESNKKMKLTNEKLERKLDEALVSLRHLHSLQENTELEYLKNILFEYLTGSGSHSITLAKVLSAVVKFDDKQTDLVLQKEKERQGLLHQLHII